MAYPVQTFSNIQALLNYINTQWITNGVEAITGVVGNNVVNALANFIVEYTVNGGLGTVSTNPGVVSLSTPVTVFAVPASEVNWADNIQFEYYVVNATGIPIPITAGFSYVDQYGVTQTSFPARQSVHIGKLFNGSWVQLNNLGVIPTNTVPPNAGQQGRVLFNNGTTNFWGDQQLPILYTDGNWVTPTRWVNGSNNINPQFNSPHFTLFWNDASRYLLRTTSPAEWDYVANGFEIFYPGFNAQLSRANLFLTFNGTA